MKKKFSAFTFINLGLISFLICIIFGLVSRHIFSFENIDTVSSAATLFAGIVALYLYTDWREPYLQTKIDQEQKELRNTIKVFRLNYHNFLYFVDVENRDKKLNNDDPLSRKYKKLISLLLDDLDEIYILLERYVINFDTSDAKDIEHKKELKKHLSNVAKFINYINKYDFHCDYIDSYKEMVNLFDKDVLTAIGENIGFDLIKTLTKSYEVLRIKGH